MPESLTPLEVNALKWVTLCQALHLDPEGTTAIEVQRLVEGAPRGNRPPRSARRLPDPPY